MSKGESYEEFVEKFKPKKTTDDCYTPPRIFEVVEKWARERSKVDISGLETIRPFYPGGDYEHEDYEGKVVIDNPPFSIYKKIVDFFVEKDIPFFIFGPALSLCTAMRDTCTAIVSYSEVRYENGAVVRTSFMTNLFGEAGVIISPELHRAIKAANDENVAREKKTVRKIVYPFNLTSAAKLGSLAVHLDEDITIDRMDMALVRGKVGDEKIFGSGLLLSDRAANLLAAARKLAYENKLEAMRRLEAAVNDGVKLSLDENCRQIIDKLNSGAGG